LTKKVNRNCETQKKSVGSGRGFRVASALGRWSALLMARIRLSCNDAFLFGALGYSAVILFLKWGAYAKCSKPLHVYLLVDYVIIALLRGAQLMTQWVADGTDFQQKCVEFVKVGILYTFFISWTVVGTVWFIHSSDCFSEDNQYWTLVFWLSLCYVWIAVYLCLLTLQYMLRSDPQFNHIGVFGGRRQMLPALLLLRLQDMPINPNQGLPPNQISAIAFCDPPSPASGVDTCSICIDHFKKDELCKKLPGCPHYFHAQCIDSWLTRKSDCPVCRTPVIVNPDVVISPRMADIV